MLFSIPYNGDLALVQWAVASGQVGEVYVDGVGLAEGGKDAGMSAREHGAVLALIEFCKGRKVPLNVLVNNPVLFFRDVKVLAKRLKALEAVAGRLTVTIADKAVVAHLRKIMPRVRIQASVYCHIDTADKMAEALKMGIDDFCLDVSTNRNGAELERIRKLKKARPGLMVKLLANHGCYAHCFYAGAHEQWHELRRMMKSGVRRSAYALGRLIGEAECLFQPQGLADEIRRPFIRPEDVGFYERQGWADGMKIAHRHDSSETLRLKLTAYFNRKYDGNIQDIMPSHRVPGLPGMANGRFPANFIQKVCSCRRECQACGYCEKTAVLVSRK